MNIKRGLPGHQRIRQSFKTNDIQIAAKENAKRALFVSKIESSILDAILRLTHLLDNPKDKKLPQMK
ncbi:hypothetical protein EH198_19360 [Paenibacillus rhizophilus]|uniref:Transcription regulator HTH AraC N-terminal domain-containing protein n=1 Tax=Paenibacillus rhizophilus TaxID=1850366 RepID=A0A3N9P0L2_9BACL|nr:hypothetical protein EH198_19360 [Paenibacillus rhizophilus]